MSTHAIAVPNPRVAAVYFAGILFTALAATLYVSASIAFPAYMPLNSVARSWISIPFAIPWAPLMASACYCLFGFGLLSGRTTPLPASFIASYSLMEVMFLMFPPAGAILREHAVPILIEFFLLALIWLLWWWTHRSPSSLSRATFTACFAVFFSCAMFGWQETPFVQRGL